jgi:hypothetical protein
MPSINLEVACHHLNVCFLLSPVHQKKRNFDGGRKKAISKEIDKLLIVGFIHEVMYLEWIVNVVMVSM